jgi:putative membrane protein
MAFGFLVERFDLFLEIAAPSLSGRRLSIPGQKFGNAAGIALILVGMAIIAIAAARYVMIGGDIDSAEPKHRPGSRFDLALASLLVLLGMALLLYLTHAFVATV